MNGINSFDSTAEKAATDQQFLSAALQLPPIVEAPEASMFPQSQVPMDSSFAWLILQQAQQMIMYQHALQQQQQQQMAPSMHIAQLPEVSQIPYVPIQMPQQPHLGTPRRVYLKRKRETPTPKRQTTAATPAQTSDDPAESVAEVNFDDHSAYKRLLSSVWDYKGDPPWSRYSAQQLSDIVKTRSSWAPKWDGQVEAQRDLFHVCAASHPPPQDMDGVLACFDWDALKVASSRKRDVLYEYVSKAVRCLWEDVHSRAGLFRSTRDAYGNLREPMRAEFKSPSRLLPTCLNVNSGIKSIVSSERGRPLETVKRQLADSLKDHDEAVSVLAHSLPLCQPASHSPMKDESAQVHNQDADNAIPPDDASNRNTDQAAVLQVPAFQGYDLLRVFVSWPPPPTDCDTSLQHSWYKKPLSKLKMEPLRLVAEALPNLRKEMLWYIACKKDMFAEDDEFRLVPGRRKLVDGKYVSIQPEEEFVIGDFTYMDIAKPTPQVLQLLKQRQSS